MLQLPTTIDTKTEMYRHLYAGRFGNYPLAWETLDEVLRSGYTGCVSLRSRQTSNPVRLYHIPFNELEKTVAELPPLHRDGGLVFSEAPPDDKRVVQGEWDGYSLTYSFYRAPMRLAFEKQLLHADGLTAKQILRHYLDAADYEWLNDLVDDFPGHVVEFSGYSCRVGTHRRRCIFWEVRKY